MRTRIQTLIASSSVLFIATSALVHSQAQSSRAAYEGASVVSQESAKDLSVNVGKTVIVDCARPASRVAIGLGGYAEASAITPTEIMVNGKAPGETTLIIWDDRGARHFYNVAVNASDPLSNGHLDAIRRELKAELPGQDLNISADNGAIFLRGTVKDLDGSARAVQIASTAGKVVNLLNVNVPPADPQILLKVRFASVDRSKSKQLGINLFSLGMGNTVGGTTTGQFPAPIISGGSASGTGSLSSAGNLATFANEANFLAFFPGLGGGADIEAMENKGLVEVLAEPNLLAANGKQASFLAGGEYPYPVVQGGSGGSGSSVSIMFKEYGVRLNFIPTVTPRGTIRLQVAPEVSSLDFTNAIEISGFTVPAIDTRKVKTEVELSDGQTFIIGGLLDNRETETLQKIPFIGDVPVLGKFFQSISRTKTNTELIVMVTPEVVYPIDAGANKPDLKYPEKFLPANSGIPMNNPDSKPNGANHTPPPATMPVEKLIESQRSQTPLVIDSAKDGFGAASSGTSAAPAYAPPQ